MRGAAAILLLAVVACGPGPGVQRSLDGGNTWVDIGPRDRALRCEAVWGRAEDELFVACARDGAPVVLHTRDRGAHWREEGGCARGVLFGVAGRDDAVYAVGDAGLCRRTGDDGWAPVPTMSGRQLRDLWIASPSELYVVGPAGLYHTRDGGASWEPGPPGAFSGVWGSAPDDVYAVGAALLHSRDAGRTWARVPVALSERPRTVWGASAQDVYVGGATATIYHSSDGGRGWSQQPLATADGVARIVGAAGRVFALDGRGAIWRTVDGGAHWQGNAAREDAPMTYDGLWLTPSGALVRAGSRASLSGRAHRD